MRAEIKGELSPSIGPVVTSLVGQLQNCENVRICVLCPFSLSLLFWFSLYASFYAYFYVIFMFIFMFISMFMFISIFMFIFVFFFCYMQHVDAACACNMDLKFGHATCKCSCWAGKKLPTLAHVDMKQRLVFHPSFCSKAGFLCNC